VKERGRMKTEAGLDLTIIVLLMEMVTAGKHSDGVEKQGQGFLFKRISLIYCFCHPSLN